MFNATVIRLFPRDVEVPLFNLQFGSSRWVWNRASELKQRFWKEKEENLSTFDLIKLLPVWKREFPWLRGADSQVLQQTMRNLGEAFKRFFQKKARFPRWKTRRSRQSFQYPQRVKIEGNRIYLPKIGWVKAKVHRKIVGRIKTVTISRTATGKYYASILTEDEKALPTPISHLEREKVIGIDLGLTHFLTTSKGEKEINPRLLQKNQRNLRRKQKALSRKEKGSKNRSIARKLVARAYEKLTNARGDFQHKISKILADENQAVGVEDLHVKGLLKNKRVARSIGDVAWSSFLHKLKYKLERAGKIFVKVDRFFPSSHICSYCNTKREKKLTLADRKWTCQSCLRELDRDENAASNIEQETIIQLKADGHTVSACGGLRKTGIFPAVA